jgi:hypothetical protein
VAHHERAEIFVGWPTVAAIEGNKIASRLADLYLARTGYESQQMAAPAGARTDRKYSTCA